MDKARWGLGKDTLPRAVMSVGGRLGYVDDGETANTQVIRFDYGDSELVFEVRGWPSDSPFPGKNSPKRGEKPSNLVGNIWYGSEGFVVCPSYSGGVAYSKDGEVLKVFNNPKGVGDHTHFENFVKAVRADKQSLLNADIEQGHLSSAMCHLGNISHMVGEEQEISKQDKPFGQKHADAAFTDMVAHLKQNKIELEGTKVARGQEADAGCDEGDVHRRQGRGQAADARVPQGLRGADEVLIAARKKASGGVSPLEFAPGERGA